MIGLLAGVPIYLCTQSVDSCKGFYGPTGIVTTAMIRYVKCNTGLAASAAKVALPAAGHHVKFWGWDPFTEGLSFKDGCCPLIRSRTVCRPSECFV